MAEFSFLTPETALLLACLSAGLAVACGALALGRLLSGPDQVARRLHGLEAGRRDEAGPLSRLRRLVHAILARLAQPARPREAWQLGKLRRQLMQAGFLNPSALNVYLGLRVLCLLLGPLLAWLSPQVRDLQPSWRVLGLVGSAAVGYLLPSIILDKITKHRQAAISRELPEVLDLLVIGVEAGLGLDAGLRRVASETQLSCPVLSRELTLVSLEIQAGIPRHKSLKNLHLRTGVDEVGSLVAMLVQADRFGVSVGKSLRIHSDEVRTKRRQKMEELAAKVPLKLLFPVLFLIFPAIMVVMAGPALIRVSEDIMK